MSETSLVVVLLGLISACTVAITIVFTITARIISKLPSNRNLSMRYVMNSRSQIIRFGFSLVEFMVVSAIVAALGLLNAEAIGDWILGLNARNGVRLVVDLALDVLAAFELLVAGVMKDIIENVSELIFEASLLSVGILVEDEATDRE